MIGCIPRDRGLEERVDREEAFNTCGIVPLLSIKRIDWITINTLRSAAPISALSGDTHRGKGVSVHSDEKFPCLRSDDRTDRLFRFVERLSTLPHFRSIRFDFEFRRTIHRCSQRFH